MNVDNNQNLEYVKKPETMPEPENPKPNNPGPDDTPKPEIPIPSTTPLSTPASTPGVDRTQVMPEYDTTNMPEENPIPRVFPEVNPENTPSIDENSPPMAGNKIGFY